MLYSPRILDVPNAIGYQIFGGMLIFALPAPVTKVPLPSATSNLGYRASNGRTSLPPMIDPVTSVSFVATVHAPPEPVLSSKMLC